MPLVIIRQDITKMECDAIVNPSNEKLLPGGGTDLAIHEAAGPELAQYCRSLGNCPTGSAKLSPAFALPCKYVIHTAGPHWDGTSQARNLLVSCYKECLSLALSHGCRSIAFPLISAGAQGFPKDQVLKIALDAISSFLLHHELTVYLLVFDRSSYDIGSKLFSKISSYIDDRYVQSHTLFRARASSIREQDRIGSPLSCQAPRSRKNRSAAHSAEEHLPSPLQIEACCEAAEVQEKERPCAPAQYASALSVANKPSLEEYIKLDKKFAYKLFDLIREKGISPVECYKKANVSKQTWYKIETDPNYKPNKKTALSFAVALELNLPQTQGLLNSVGFVLSNSSLFDVIMMYCIENGIYDVPEIDSILFHYDQETLFSKA